MAIEEQLITKNLELWTSAVKEKRAAGRGKSRKKENHGTKKLRELILDLAIKGKLAQADPKDEPASELLAHILKTKDRLAEDGLIKKQKSLGRIEDHELPFAIATNWEWVRLGEIADIVRGVTYRKADASDIKSPNTMPLMRANNIDGELNYNDLIHIPSDLVKDNQRIREGDVLIAMSSGSTDLVGKAAQAKEDLGKTFGAFCGVVRSFTPALFDYFGFFFQTPFYRKQTRESGKGIGIQNLNQGALSSLLVPIPPLAEQHRIVAKSDELIALCDQLEEEQENNLETHETLVSTLLNALTAASADASQFADAWQRIQDNFDILFKTESSVDQLKQTILQLALMGKLVKQQESIDASSTDHSVAISTEEAPYTKPIGWEWKKIGDHVKIKGGSQPNKNTFINEPRDGYTRLIQIRDFKSDNFKTYIPTELANRPFTKEDVMIGRYGPPVFQILRGLEGSYNVALMKAKPDTKFINNDYLFYLLQEPRIQKIIIDESERTAGQSGIRLPLLNSIKYGLPPLGEQHLIVSKIEKLIALCDQLKESLVVAQATQLNLADSIVEQAIQSTA